MKPINIFCVNIFNMVFRFSGCETSPVPQNRFVSDKCMKQN